MPPLSFGFRMTVLVTRDDDVLQVSFSTCLSAKRRQQPQHERVATYKRVRKDELVALNSEYGEKDGSPK